MTLTAPVGEAGYSWIGPANGIITSDTLSSITIDSAGTYSVIVTPVTGALCKDTLSITIPGVDKLTDSAFGSTTCNGFAGTATATVLNGTPPYTYTWSPGGQTTAIATGLTNGIYTVTVTDASGCSANSSAAVIQSLALIANIAIVTNPSCNGALSGSATVNASGGTSQYIYNWSNGQSTTIATGLNAGNYSVTVKDANGCSTTATVTITQPAPLTATITGTTTNVTCNGNNNGSAIVSASGGTSPYTYNWSNGQSTTIATGLNAGNYSVTVKDANGCSTTATVTITQPAPLTATITGTTTNVTCNGNNNGSAIVSASGGTSPYTYSWTGGQTNTTATGLSAGVYIITVKDYNGCSAMTLVNITQPAPLIAGAGFAPAFVNCSGGNNGIAAILATGGSSPYNYSWIPGGQTNATATGLSSGTYTVTITDTHGCTITDSASITQPAALAVALGTIQANVNCNGGNNGSALASVAGGTPPYTYSWAPGGQTDATAHSLATGTYTATITDANGCSATSSVAITVYALLTVNINRVPEDCSGAPATLTAQALGGRYPYAYNWSSGSTRDTAIVRPVYSTYYTNTVTDANGCIANASTTVSVKQNSALGLAYSGNTTVCPGGIITLTANGLGGDSAFNYLWLPGNLTTRSVSFIPKNDTSVIIELTDGCGSPMQKAIIPVTVTPLPEINITSEVKAGCIPLCVQFKNLTYVPSGGNYQWHWNFGNGDTTSGNSPSYCYKNSGEFSITLAETSNNGCNNTLKIPNMIKAYSLPTARFTYSPQQISIQYPEVQFADQSSGESPIIQWYWNFGQGDSVSSLQNPRHFYGDTGGYCPSLIVMDNHGCIDSITNCLIVNPLFTFYIPSAFTPNGDGLNDTFIPKGTYIKDFEMYIFDRWGLQLYHSISIKKGWDGTYRGIPCQEDSYVYMIHVSDTRDNKHSYIGKVTIIR